MSVSSPITLHLIFFKVSRTWSSRMSQTHWPMIFPDLSVSSQVLGSQMNTVMPGFYMGSGELCTSPQSPAA